jgi:hypothetical protein
MVRSTIKKFVRGEKYFSIAPVNVIRQKIKIGLIIKIRNESKFKTKVLNNIH